MMGNPTTPPPRTRQKIVSFSTTENTVKSKIDWSKISQAASFGLLVTNVEVTPVVLDPGTFKPLRGVKVAFDWDQLQDWMANADDGELANHIGNQILDAINGRREQNGGPVRYMIPAVRTIDDPWVSSKE